MQKRKIYFVNGALGSGKTTLINQLIDSNRLKSLFIIENEISNFSIDNTCLHLDPKQIKVIAGECICCKDPKELSVLLDEMDKRFENIIIESSGVVSLDKLLEVVIKNEKLSKVFEIGACIFVVDALGLSRTDLNDLELADFVVVTKYDELKSHSQLQKVSDFMKKDFSQVNFRVKRNISDFRWVEDLLENKSTQFRDWDLKVHSDKTHGQSYIKVLKGHELEDINLNISSDWLRDKKIERMKGYLEKSGLLYHMEATPELVSVQPSMENIAQLGLVVIGKNEVLLQEFINKISK